jgi:hypothetical protein
VRGPCAQLTHTHTSMHTYPLSADDGLAPVPTPGGAQAWLLMVTLSPGWHGVTRVYVYMITPIHTRWSCTHTRVLILHSAPDLLFAT